MSHVTSQTLRVGVLSLKSVLGEGILSLKTFLRSERGFGGSPSSPGSSRLSLVILIFVGPHQVGQRTRKQGPDIRCDAGEVEARGNVGSED